MATKKVSGFKAYFTPTTTGSGFGTLQVGLIESSGNKSSLTFDRLSPSEFTCLILLFNTDEVYWDTSINRFISQK